MMAGYLDPRRTTAGDHWEEPARPETERAENTTDEFYFLRDLLDEDGNYADYSKDPNTIVIEFEVRDDDPLSEWYESLDLDPVDPGAEIIKPADHRSTVLEKRSQPRRGTLPRLGADRPATVAFHLAGALLPTRQRARYIEEWRSELCQLREDREPWYRLIAFVARIVSTSPHLGFTIRQPYQRATD
jgi:hypothetical protein